jgi:hypothetical protein
VAVGLAALAVERKRDRIGLVAAGCAGVALAATGAIWATAGFSTPQQPALGTQVDRIRQREILAHWEANLADEEFQRAPVLLSRSSTTGRYAVRPLLPVRSLREAADGSDPHRLGVAVAHRFPPTVRFWDLGSGRARCVRGGRRRVADTPSLGKGLADAMADAGLFVGDYIEGRCLEAGS